MHTLRAEGHDAGEDGTGRGHGLVVGTLRASGGRRCGSEGVDGVMANHIVAEQARTLSASGHRLDGDTDTFVADLVQATHPENRSTFAPDSPCLTLTTSSRPVVFPAVRRLSVMEWERLQGLPDGYTAIPYRRRAVAADSPRYRAIGNGMAVPVLRWIGERIELVERVFAEAA